MTPQKTNRLLLASLAVNIFLAAFLIGRLSAPFGAPPMMGGPGFHGEQHFADGSAPPPDGPGGHRPHHAPFIIPEMVLSDAEMQAERPFAEAHFEKIQALRSAFTQKLSQNKNLSAQEINAHFDEVEAVMDALKNHMHEKIAEKISAMTPTQRQEFVQKMLAEPSQPGGFNDSRPMPQGKPAPDQPHSPR